jgi:hypothetical protein
VSRSETTWRTLVVGGHTRSIGKTSLVVDLIRAFPEARWTAVKITQYGHGVCARNGENCGCEPDDHAAALDWEANPASGTDTSRFLGAGAVRAIWLRTKQGRLAEGLPLLRSALAEISSREDFTPGDLILESNSLLQFLKPALYLVVLDPAEADFKDSARLYLDRADAFVLRGQPGESPGQWAGVSLRTVIGKPHFLQPVGGALPGQLRQLVAERFFAAEPVSF